MQKELVLSIEGMHCGACIRRVTDALGRMEGVRVNSVEVGSADVTFDSEEVTSEKIAVRISQIGFAARTEK
jgi:copper chaperone